MKWFFLILFYFIYLNSFILVKNNNIYRVNPIKCFRTILWKSFSLGFVRKVSLFLFFLNGTEYFLWYHKYLSLSPVTFVRLCFYFYFNGTEYFLWSHKYLSLSPVTFVPLSVLSFFFMLIDKLISHITIVGFGKGEGDDHDRASPLSFFTWTNPLLHHLECCHHLRHERLLPLDYC